VPNDAAFSGGGGAKPSIAGRVERAKWFWGFVSKGLGRFQIQPLVANKYFSCGIPFNLGKVVAILLGGNHLSKPLAIICETLSLCEEPHHNGFNCSPAHTTAPNKEESWVR